MRARGVGVDEGEGVGVVEKVSNTINFATAPFFPQTFAACFLHCTLLSLLILFLHHRSHAFSCHYYTHAFIAFAITHLVWHTTPTNKPCNATFTLSLLYEQLPRPCTNQQCQWSKIFATEEYKTPIDELSFSFASARTTDGLFNSADG